jgi:porin
MLPAFLRRGLTASLLPLAAAAQTPGPATSGPAVPPGLWERDTLTGDWGGLRPALEAAGVTVRLQEQGEVWDNLAGGAHRGAVYDGLTTASLSLDLEKLAGWSGATFFVNAYQIHGRGPSANLVGNIQTVSGLEATRDTKLYQLYLEQTLLDHRLTVRLGQEGANDQMMLTQYGALFLNSSFGFPALAAVDLPSGAPNFPLATPFVRVAYQATPAVTLVGAVFNGDPAPAGTGDPQLRDKGGVAFRLNGHALAFTEVWYSVNQDKDAAGLPGVYKLGAWYHSGSFADQVRDTRGVPLASPLSNGVPARHAGDYAVYGVMDQMLWRPAGGAADQGIGAFLLATGAPGGFNPVNLFVAGGLNWKGMLPGRPDDTAGIGVSYLGISPATRRYGSDVVYYTGSGAPYRSQETVVELTYLYQVAPWWTLQPDLQVVVNPGAGIPNGVSSRPLRDDVITGVRATITF